MAAERERNGEGERSGVILVPEGSKVRYSAGIAAKTQCGELSVSSLGRTDSS